MVSCHFVSAVKNERVQKYLVSVAIAAFTINSYAWPTSAITIEYGQTANKILNQAV